MEWSESEVSWEGQGQLMGTGSSDHRFHPMKLDLALQAPGGWADTNGTVCPEFFFHPHLAMR